MLAGANGYTNPEVITRSVSAGEGFRVLVNNNSLTQSATYTLTIDVQ